MNTWLEVVMPHVVATGNIPSFDHVDLFFAFSNNVLKILIGGPPKHHFPSLQK